MPGKGDSNKLGYTQTHWILGVCQSSKNDEATLSMFVLKKK